MTTSHTKRPYIIPNGRKIFQMVIKYLHQHFPFQGPPKFTQIWIFGSKTNHLATLRCTTQHQSSTSAPYINYCAKFYLLHALFSTWDIYGLEPAINKWKETKTRQKMVLLAEISSKVQKHIFVEIENEFSGKMRKQTKNKIKIKKRRMRIWKARYFFPRRNSDNAFSRTHRSLNFVTKNWDVELDKKTNTI
jgi:hypothetical protein